MDLSAAPSDAIFGQSTNGSNATGGTGVAGATAITSQSIGTQIGGYAGGSSTTTIGGNASSAGNCGANAGEEAADAYRSAG